MADNDGDILDELSPGPEEEREDEIRPDPSSEKQQEELDDMLEGADSSGGQTSGASDPTDVVSDSSESGGDQETDPQVQREAERQEALENLQENEDDGSGKEDVGEKTSGASEGVASKSVEEVLEDEGVESVGEIARQFSRDMRTGVPSTCELGCNVQPDEKCPHGHPSIIKAYDE